MEFRLLGPVEVGVAGAAGSVALGPPRQRAVLAMLALAAPAVVSTDRLVAGLWADRPPARPLPSLQVFVHGLRKALRTASDLDVVARVAPGYRLEVDPLAVDVHRFADLHARARALRSDGALTAAASAYAEGLALWRGPALADVRGDPFAEPEAVRLEELHLQAREESYDVRLAVGEHAALADELERAVQEHPMRERFWGQLMTAHYRCDRQGDALATYGRARDRLADELGIDPGRALQQLEIAVLRQDPTLAAPTGPLTAVTPRAVSRVPRPVTPTFGRDELVAEVRALLDDPANRAITLTGPGGSGKSRLAVLVAQLETERPVVHLVATERTDAAQLGRELALALTGSDDGDALTDLALDTLVVLDNLEFVVDGAAPFVARLLEQSSRITVLGTSRLPLRIRAERTVPVPPLVVPAVGASLEEIADAPAVQMFLDRSRAAAGMDPDLEEVAELCRFLDGLPLAIELAAAFAGTAGPARVLDELDDNLGFLAARSGEVPEWQRTLVATLEWSHHQLRPDARTILDRLALFERGFTLEAVEAVCDDVPDVLGALADLVDARLVRSLPSRVEVRYVVSGTVRAFARERLRKHGDLDARWAAHADYLLTRLRVWAGDLDGPQGTTVLGRYDDTAGDVDAALAWATASGRPGTAVDLVVAASGLWVASGRSAAGLVRVDELLLTAPAERLPELHLAEARLAYHLTAWDRVRAACDAVLTGTDTDSIAATEARCYLGATLVVTGSPVDGARLAETALAEAMSRDAYPVSAVALSALAIARAITGDADGERALYLQRLEVVTAHGDVARMSDTLNTLAEIALDEPDALSARAYAEESLAVAGTALPLEIRDATITLARAAVVDGESGVAARHLSAALELADRTGQSFAVAQCLRAGGGLAVLLGEPVTALRAFSAAQRISPSPSGTDDPIEGDLSDQLGRARAALGGDRTAREWALGRTLPVATVRSQLERLVAGATALSRH